VTTAPGKRNMGTMAIVGVLSVILLVGTLMFGYFGYQLLVRKPAPSGQAGTPTPKGTGAAVVDSQALTRTPTPARTGVVIVAATAVPPTSEGAPGASEEQTPTPTRRSAQKTAVAPGSSGGSSSGGGGKLPQTGLGLGTPVIGLLLAGVASVARWMRQRR
jgi:hypothetical protein